MINIKLILNKKALQCLYLEGSFYNKFLKKYPNKIIDIFLISIYSKHMEINGFM